MAIITYAMNGTICIDICRFASHMSNQEIGPQYCTVNYQGVLKMDKGVGLNSSVEYNLDMYRNNTWDLLIIY